MPYFSTKTLPLFYSCDIPPQERARIDLFLSILEGSGCGEILAGSYRSLRPKPGRKPYDPCSLFALVVYSFSMRRMSLRDMADFCMYDLRARYIMEQETPSYKTICGFLNHVVFPVKDRIFPLVNRAMLSRCGVDASTVYIDGTKIEADANKYKFVWKPRRNLRSLRDRMSEDFARLGIAIGEVNSRSVSSALSRLQESRSEELAAYGRGRKSSPEAHCIVDIGKRLPKLLEYEEAERICGPGRNSYYKTDHDATAMALKTDYYSGHGSNMHAAYNVQFAVSDGFIVCFGVFQDRADYYTFAPMLEEYHRIYRCYPLKAVADSGYGIYANYAFLSERHIGNYVKFQAWEGEASGKRPRLFTLLGDCSVRCLNGKTAKPQAVPSRHPEGPDRLQYLFRECRGCRYAYLCRKSLSDREGGTRYVEMNPEYERYKDAARSNLQSPEGIRLRINRTIQSEGCFGIMKEDMNKTRLKRTGLKKAELEFMLVCLGTNTRKLFKWMTDPCSSKIRVSFPEDLKPEVFPVPKPMRPGMKTRPHTKKPQKKRPLRTPNS